VSSGLYEAGFQYINIDDGFFDGRNEDGSLRINAGKFPSGMKTLADYIHSKGLKAGFYTDAGINTCGSEYSGQTGGLGGGLYGHDQQDMNQIFLDWGFDFIKVDYCGGLRQQLDEQTRYSEIRLAIDRTGRKDIHLNVCRWQFPGTWVTKVADSWRMSSDINFSPGSKPKWNRIVGIIQQNKYLAPYAGAGHYNDMDMLEVGRGMTQEEDKSHFTMWCLLSSPLVLGNDLTQMSEATKALLTNPEVIAVNQDPAGLQAMLINEKNGLQVWAKHLHDLQSKEMAVALFNPTAQPATLSVSWSELNIVGGALVRDLWERRDIGLQETGYSAVIPSHGIQLIKVTARQVKPQTVFEAEYGWINHFNLTRYTKLVPDQGKPVADSLCSGGAKVISLGKDPGNYLEFRTVYAPAKGVYPMTLHYLSGENRKAIVTVNDKAFQLDQLNSGSWQTIATRTMRIPLKKGYNLIRIANDTGWLPDMDKITIDWTNKK